MFKISLSDMVNKIILFFIISQFHLSNVIIITQMKKLEDFEINIEDQRTFFKNI